MAKNELLPFADGEDANVLPTNQWEALTDILENGFQSGIARSEQVNRVLAQGAVASYVLGQLIVDQLNKDATLNKDTLYQNLVSALQENAKDACLPLSGGNVTGNLTVQGKNVLRSVNGTNADASGNANVNLIPDYTAGVSKSWNTNITAKRDCFVVVRCVGYNGTVSLIVNGVTVLEVLDGGLGSPIFTLSLFIKKGDVYKGTGVLTSTLTEYPLK